MNVYFSARVENNELKFAHPDEFQRTLNRLDGQKVQVLVRKYKTQRTNKQNRYYWGVIVQILGDEFGYTREEMHEALKWEFLRKGEKLPTVRSTTTLTTTEFNTYVDKIKLWAATEYGIVIPEPNEVDY